MSVNLGRVAYVEKGAYDGGTTYESKDVVSFNGGSYVYVGDTPAANVPPTDEAHWQPLIDPTAMNEKIAELDDAKQEALAAATTASEKAQEATAAANTANTAAEAADEARLSIADELNKKAPAIFVDASGDMVHITDGAEGMPVQRLVTHVANGGSITLTRAGKNLFPVSSITFTGQKREYFATEMPPGTYTISTVVTSGDTDQSTSRIAFMDSAGNVFSYVNFSRGARDSQTVTVGQAFNSIRFYAATTVSNSSGDKATWDEIMVEKSETATDFEPYNGETLTAESPEAGVYDWLEGQQLSTLKGTNNIWSNAGETEVTYAADTKMYIDQKIAAIAAAIVNE